MIKILWGIFFIAAIAAQGIAQKHFSQPYDSSKNTIQNIQGNPDWASFLEKLQHAGNHKESSITIVHIGDSHIQGGYFTNRFRELLSQHYHVAGRGFTFPYILLKANGPEDIKFTSSSKWMGEKYNHSRMKEKTFIAGYNLLSTDTSANISITLRQEADSLYPFRELNIFYNNPSLQIRTGTCAGITYETLDSGLFVSQIKFNKLQDSVTLQMHCLGRVNMYGFELKRSSTGILYHTIGVNGISFDAYLNALNYLPMLKALKPDCIILSLGTNDAYLRVVDTLKLKTKVRSLLSSIKKELPPVCFLLTTPGDHLLQKKYVNQNLEKAHAAILSAAQDQNCAVWDFYKIMGGIGSSKTWHQAGLMYSDILHLSRQGYKLQGDLFFSAFDEAIKKTKIDK